MPSSSPATPSLSPSAAAPAGMAVPARRARAAGPLGRAVAALASVASVAALGLALALVPAAPALAGGDWNDAGIAWKSLDAGLAEAKSADKPVCLVFYTDWCPHCTNYSRVFHDKAVVEAAKSFVMVRINKDQDAAASAKYAPDGQYIPRTFFLKSDGTLRTDVTEQRDQYRYFYDEDDPASLLRAMKTALGQAPAAAAAPAAAN